MILRRGSKGTTNLWKTLRALRPFYILQLSRYTVHTQESTSRRQDTSLNGGAKGQKGMVGTKTVAIQRL